MHHSVLQTGTRFLLNPGPGLVRGGYFETMAHSTIPL